MDLVTLGEGLIRLSSRYEQANTQLDLVGHIGGAELNVAVAAAHLGVAARWVSCLPDNALGRFIESQVRAHGVDTHVEWSDGRVGLYFLAPGDSPRQPSVVYDRAGSAFSRTPPNRANWQQHFAGARWFHITGITPALSETAAALTLAALHAAKAAGLTVSYDVNYRVRLWDAERARAVQEPLLRLVDVLIISCDDAQTVFQVNEASPEEAARMLAQRFGVKTVAVTVRDSADGIGAIVVANGATFNAPRCDVEVVERVGTGDAFAAGLISARLMNRSWGECVRFAVATAALKLTMPGDFFVGEHAQVENLVNVMSVRAEQ